MVRLCLDVNVWVSHYLSALRRPGTVSASGGLARAVFTGASRQGPTQVVVSHAMLDTLEDVLKRLPVMAPYAEMARDQIEAAAGGGFLSNPPAVILGGSAAYPLLDEEDAAVLNAAMAGGADLLVTHNISDFVRGPRSQADTATLSETRGAPDVILLRHPKRPGGLLIASPFRAAAWLLRGEPPPAALPQKS